MNLHVVEPGAAHAAFTVITLTVGSFIGHAAERRRRKRRCTCQRHHPPHRPQGRGTLIIDTAARRADVMTTLLKHSNDALTRSDTLRRALTAAADKPNTAIPVELFSQALTAELEAQPWRELGYLGFNPDTDWNDFARMLPTAISRATEIQTPPDDRGFDLVYTADAVSRSKAMNQFMTTTAEARALIAEGS